MSEDDDVAKTFTVVEFPDEGTEAVVPTSWLLLDGDECLWPKPGQEVLPLVLSSTRPAEDWPVRSVRAMTRCRTYKKACRKMSRTEDVSTPYAMDLESEVVGQPRLDVPRSAPSRLTLPTPPPGLVGISLDQRKPEGLRKRKRMEELPTPGFELQVLKQLTDIQEQNRKISSQNVKLKSMVKTLLSRVIALEELTEPETPALPLFVLPLENMAQFEAAEMRLREAADRALLKQQLLSYFSVVSLTDAVHRVMGRLIRKAVQECFSMLGKKGKLPFKNTHLCTVAVAAIQDLFAAFVAENSKKATGQGAEHGPKENAKELDVQRLIGRFLAAAPDREGGRNERAAKWGSPAAVSASFAASRDTTDSSRLNGGDDKDMAATK